MKGIERLRACVSLEKVDRPGILPSYMDRFAALQAGLTFADILARPVDASAAMRKLWDRFGGWGLGLLRWRNGYLLPFYQTLNKGSSSGKASPPRLLLADSRDPCHRPKRL